MTTIEEEFQSLMDIPLRSYKPTYIPESDPLRGTLDSLAITRDYKLAQRGSGDLQSIKQLIIPVITAGEATGSPFQLGDVTGILLAPRTTGETGAEQESSDTARIYIQINNSGVWIPMSFNIAQQGSQKGDAQFIAGPIATVRIRVVNVTEDVINQPYMILWFMRGITVVGQFGGANLYGSPISSVTPGAVSQGGSSPQSGGGGGGGGTGGGSGGTGGGKLGSNTF